MFIATLNKTLKSYLFAIIGAEYVLRWLPIGTHEWEKFVKPEDLIKIQKKNNLELEKIDGMKFNLLSDKWSLSSDKSSKLHIKIHKKLIFLSSTHGIICVSIPSFLSSKISSLVAFPYMPFLFFFSL